MSKLGKVGVALGVFFGLCIIGIVSYRIRDVALKRRQRGQGRIIKFIPNEPLIASNQGVSRMWEQNQLLKFPPIVAAVSLVYEPLQLIVIYTVKPVTAVQHPMHSPHARYGTRPGEMATSM